MAVSQQDIYRQLINKLGDFDRRLTQLMSLSSMRKEWLDSAEVCQLLHISKRTLQNYRDNKIIQYSTLGGRFYYRLSDIHQKLEKENQARMSDTE